MLSLGSRCTFDRPVVALAPMEAVTDPPFRRICKQFGADIVYTEFISSEGLRRGASKSVRKLAVFDDERPVAIQIFGNDREAMVEAALIAESAQPDFIDLNFGCPAKQVAGRGAGSGLLCNPNLMETITGAVVNAVHLPVTAKTRIGWDEKSISILDTVRRLEDQGIQALTIHGRTRSQMFKGKSDWGWIAKAKEIATIPIIGNGDIWSADDGYEKLERSGVNGIMIGRGSIGNPFIFRAMKARLETGVSAAPPTFREQIDIAIQHLKLSIEWKGEHYGVIEMRKHYSTYLKGLPHVSKVRHHLVREKSVDQIMTLLHEFEHVCEQALKEGQFNREAEYLNDHSKRLILEPYGTH